MACNVVSNTKAVTTVIQTIPEYLFILPFLTKALYFIGFAIATYLSQPIRIKCIYEAL